MLVLRPRMHGTKPAWPVSAETSAIRMLWLRYNKTSNYSQLNQLSDKRFRITVERLRLRGVLNADSVTGALQSRFALLKDLAYGAGRIVPAAHLASVLRDRGR